MWRKYSFNYLKIRLLEIIKCYQQKKIVPKPLWKYWKYYIYIIIQTLYRPNKVPKYILPRYYPLQMSTIKVPFITTKIISELLDIILSHRYYFSEILSLVIFVTYFFEGSKQNFDHVHCTWTAIIQNNSKFFN